MPNNSPSFFGELGELNYNGYAFDSATKITARSTNVRDEADRTTVYIQHELTVRSIIAPVSEGSQVSADDYMDRVRRLLSQDGQALTFRNKGFGGAVTINGASGMKDVKWGPKTQELSWEPIGSSYACEIVWRVTFCLPLCCCGQEMFTGIMAANYEAEYDVDQHGLTTRTITGYLEIAQTRIPGSKAVPESADTYWTAIQATVPIGYRRTVCRRRVSKDKSRLDYTIVDEQVDSPNPWPAYVTDIRGSHTANWARRNGAEFRNTISMEITPKLGLNGSFAWSVFGQIVSKRLLATQDRGRQWFIDELFANEDLFGRTCSFRISYRILSTIKDLLGDSGLWTPLGNDWQTWQTSVAVSSRGVSGLQNYPSMDAIVDLCGGSPSSTGTNGDLVSQEGSSTTQTFKNTKPRPEESYLHYKARLTPYKRTPTYRQKRQTKDENSNWTSDWNPRSESPFNFPGRTSAANDDVILQRGVAGVDVIFEGAAIRAGYQVPRPAVNSIGGVPAVEEVAIYPSGFIGNYFGVPVYGAAWKILYRLGSLPSNLNLPDDVQEGIYNGQADQPNT